MVMSGRVSTNHDHERAPAKALSPKHRRIIDAATGLFLAVGYGATSMDAIAQAAGVSKVTVYNHFGSKDALFAAIINATCDSMLLPITAREVDRGSPETTLSAIAGRVMRMARDPQILALYRVVIAEAPKFPELGAAFYRAGPARAAENLAAWLAEQTRAGVLTVDDPRLAAERFFGMAHGHFYLRRLLNVQPEDDEATIAAHVRAVVAGFLTMHRAAAAPGAGSHGAEPGEGRGR
jgi:TetR/AcrR family transcriptional regulator, mexJK operon transcriptional repressor